MNYIVKAYSYYILLIYFPKKSELFVSQVFGWTFTNYSFPQQTFINQCLLLRLIHDTFHFLGKFLSFQYIHFVLINSLVFFSIFNGDVQFRELIVTSIYFKHFINDWLFGWLVCLFGVFRPTREFFTHLETSPFPLKCFKLWTLLGTYGHMCSEGFLACHTNCDMGYLFIMVIYDDPSHSHLLPSVWQWSCHYLFLRLRSFTAIIRTPDLPLAERTL